MREREWIASTRKVRWIDLIFTVETWKEKEKDDQTAFIANPLWVLGMFRRLHL